MASEVTFFGSQLQLLVPSYSWRFQRTNREGQNLTGHELFRFRLQLFFFFFCRREGEGVREVERECMTGEMRQTLLRTVTLHKTHIVLFWVMYALGN